MSALTWSSFSNLTEQPGLREAPTALNSSWRDSYISTASFGAVASASVINQDAAHHFRCDAKKLGPVLPTRVLLIYEPDVRLMNQVSSLQRLSGTLPP